MNTLAFVVVNPSNCSTVEVFSTIELAIESLTSNGFKQLWEREVKVSPNARVALANNATGEISYIYCRELHS